MLHSCEIRRKSELSFLKKSNCPIHEIVRTLKLVQNDRSFLRNWPIRVQNVRTSVQTIRSLGPNWPILTKLSDLFWAKLSGLDEIVRTFTKKSEIVRSMSKMSDLFRKLSDLFPRDRRMKLSDPYPRDRRMKLTDLFHEIVRSLITWLGGQIVRSFITWLGVKLSDP